jgi:hypothetical protein
MTSNEILALAAPVLGFSALALGGWITLRLNIRQAKQKKAKRKERLLQSANEAASVIDKNLDNQREQASLSEYLRNQGAQISISEELAAVAEEIDAPAQELVRAVTSAQLNRIVAARGGLIEAVEATKSRWRSNSPDKQVSVSRPTAFVWGAAGKTYSKTYTIKFNAHPESTTYVIMKVKPDGTLSRVTPADVMVREG